MSDIEDSDVSNSSPPGKGRKNAKEHVKQLQRLQEKDPEFYQYLKDCDKALLDFNDEDIDEDEGIESEGDMDSQLSKKLQQSSAKVITTAMVDTWCAAIKEEGKLGAVRSLLRAFRTACHCGDDSGTDLSSRFSILSSSVFNKIMVFVLNEMDGILRGLLKAPSTGGKKETVMELMTTKAWKNHGSMMKLYLGNGLHILTEMTDEQMISFTLKRIKASAVFLAAFPTLLRKYIKVALHSWGTGRGALPVVSFLFLRDLCVRIGADCIDSCLKGVYKAYVSNCKLAKSVSRSKLQHIHFLGNCVTELYGVDLPSAYQHAFVFVRQLAAILQGAITERGSKAKDKTKGKKQQEASKTAKQQDKAYQKVYDWQFINCLELWTGIICAYNSEDDFRPLAYPLTQIIYGVACLVPTARYLPLRLRCVRMLNRIAEATGAFIPVSSLLLDMLEMKELNRIPTGGIGKAVNLIGIKQVDKSTLKTRAFQEACIYLIVEELTEHLSQWSYSVAFFEMSFIPLVRLRSFCKTTKADKFRREIKELIRQVEANSEFMISQRTGIELSPTDPAITSFLKSGKESGSSPLSQFAANLRRRAQQRNESIVESSIIVGERSSQFHNETSESEEEEDGDDEDDGVTVFSSTWLPEKKSKTVKEKSSKKRQHEQEHNEGMDEDIVEDLILSSEDDDDIDGDGGGAVLPKSSSEKNGEPGPKRSSYKPARKKKKVTTSLKQDGKKVITSVKQDGKKPNLADSSSKKKLRQRWKKKTKKGVTV